MFENEEKKLHDMKLELDALTIPEDALNVAIEQGVKIAANSYRLKHRKQRKSLWSLAITAVLLLTFITSIRVSPAFASAISSIPGLGKIVELIQYDKGIQAIVDNEYYQQVNASQTVDDITLTINGLIVDETGVVVSYTLEAPYPISAVGYEDVRIFKDDMEIKKGSWSYDHPNQENQNRKEDVLNLMFWEKESFNTRSMKIEITLENEKETTFSIPFTLNQEVKKGKVYPLKQEVVIEGQKLVIDEITIYPLRVAVDITFDETNTKEIYNFQDMRIEDEKGEKWSSIQNGSSGRGFGETQQTFFLQSNYFEKPNKLYFKINQLQALPKEEAYVLLDLQKGKVLKQPSDGKIEFTSIRPNSVEVRYKQTDEVNRSLFYQAENANGEEVESNSVSMHHDEGYAYSTMYFTKPERVNPVKITFESYPNYINGDINIELK